MMCGTNSVSVWRKIDFQVDFWKSSLWSFAKLQNILSFCVSFWRRLWFQKFVENFLCVVRIRSDFVKHFTGSEEYSALWMMTLWLTKNFYYRKSDFRVDFWNSSIWSSVKLQNILSFCVSFWRRLWLQKPVENFLCVVCIHTEYVKRSPISGKCSAR